MKGFEMFNASGDARKMSDGELVGLCKSAGIEHVYGSDGQIHWRVSGGENWRKAGVLSDFCVEPDGDPSAISDGARNLLRACLLMGSAS